jgi:hypothetical protein
LRGSWASTLIECRYKRSIHCAVETRPRSRGFEVGFAFAGSYPSFICVNPVHLWLKILNLTAGVTPQPLCGHSMNFYRILRKSSVKGKSARMGASRASIFPALWLCGRAGQACG